MRVQTSGEVLMTNGAGGGQVIRKFHGALFDAYGQQPFRLAD
jgi:hypothetical protein